MSKNKSLIPRNSFDAILSLNSDWHIGSGTGRTGDIDRLVQRDAEELPYISAKTITGIWRDACEVVAWGLDNGQNGSWSKWVDYLFGEQPALAKTAIETPPRPAALSVRSAHLPLNLRQLLKLKPELKAAITFIKPGISIDSFSGCAVENFLRFEEMVRGGAILEAKCELSLPKDGEQKQAAYALLIAGSQFIERLGGKRRRGAGKCKLVVETETNIHLWIDWLESHPQAPDIPDIKQEKDQAVNQETVKIINDDWLLLKMRVTTTSPVIISKRTIGNVVESLDYIPGTHLLRLVKRRLSNFGVIDRAISQGNIVVTNAVIEIDKQRGKPVPLCLFGEKATGGLAKGGKVYNRFVESEPQGQLKGERAGYINTNNNSYLPSHKKVNLGIETHNTIEDEYQRPTSDVGGVYSYQAIPPNTILQAEIKLHSQLANALRKKQPNWWNLLNGRDRLGQSKKDHYGTVQLEVLGNPIKLSATTPANNSELAVWLLSDVLLRDERLRPTASIECLAKELEKRLNFEVKLTLKNNQDHNLSLMARQHRLDSWQVRWGLPRPSLVGLSAGSCMVFKVDGNLNPAKLGQIEASGIGERTAEGYGQICFNHPLLISPTQNLPLAPELPLNSAQKKVELIKESDNRVFGYARIIEREAWRDAIRKAVLSLAATAESRKNILGISINGQGNKKESHPPLSQLGALVSVLARLQSLPDKQRAIGWLDNLEARANRKDKWSADSLSKIRTLINNQNQIWQILQISFADLTLTVTGQENLKTELWAEAVRILIDGCVRAHKRDCD